MSLHVYAHGKFLGGAGGDKVQADFVFGGVGRAHPRLDAEIRRVGCERPGDEGRVRRRHFDRAAKPR